MRAWGSFGAETAKTFPILIIIPDLNPFWFGFLSDNSTGSLISGIFEYNDRFCPDLLVLVMVYLSRNS